MNVNIEVIAGRAAEGVWSVSHDIVLTLQNFTMQLSTILSFCLALPLSIRAGSSLSKCKAVPGTSSWPPESSWEALNKSLSGALIKSVPPGGVCHPGQPNYDGITCPTVQALWNTSWAFHSDDPVSIAENNWDNDTCLPYAQYPCSDVGYPVYVVNASTAEHVKAGVNFARENNVRLIIKTSSHDFRGRSVAPYALSIWMHNLRGLSYQESYKSCWTRYHNSQATLSYNGPAVTMAAGEDHGAAFEFANKYGKMIHVAGAPTVGLGGYITGGGHSLISFQKGLAADAVLEMTVVLPSGKIVTANACQNRDIFWALRGGGGSTLGVILSFTTKAFPSEPVTMSVLGFGSPNFNDSAFWNATAYIASQFPGLSNGGIMTYSNAYVATAATPAYFQGIFLGLNKTASETIAVVEPVAKKINATFAPDVISVLPLTQEYPSYYNWWINHQDSGSPIGIDIAIGSRLLDKQALTRADLATYLKTASGVGSLQMNLVAGPGTHAFPEDFNALSPAWRTSYVHAVAGVGWPPLDPSAKAAQMEALTYNYTAALRDLAPNTGCYVNEVWLGKLYQVSADRINRQMLTSRASKKHSGVPTTLDF